ncbi:MAG: hypothetical protein JWP97_2153 [Labilithrix sp.]|nr:hypothetical protein [Labilithrix sp.]
MSHEGWHEQPEELTSSTKDLHRAIVSLQEELEAVDWYQQRVDATPDESLKAILAHNRDEEIEHAIMTLEWIRRRVPKFDENMRTYLFTEVPITEVEEQMKEGGEDGEREDAAARKVTASAPKGERGKQHKHGGHHGHTPSGKNDGSLGIRRIEHRTETKGR